MSNSIYVQIASYKDSELIPTIEDLLANAEYPNNLTIGICNQTNDFSNLDRYRNDKRFRIIDVPWQKSQGVCWARYQLQKLWNGEEYTLQLDSHHRFELNWDTTLINFLKQTESKKPILSTYVGSYDPISETKDYIATVLLPNYFTNENILLLKAEKMPNWKSRNTPFRGCFLSGHFIFTLGIFNKEVVYDPTLYFQGEEISLSLRAYTHGYDIFYPHRAVIFHEYIRNNKTKHWNEHNEFNKKNNIVDLNWWERDLKSKNKLKNFFETLNPSILGEFGLGNVRTVEQYEKYAGIHFKTQSIHPLALKGKEMPINDKIVWWLKPNKEYSLKINITPFTCSYDYIFIGIEDKNNILLHRIDLNSFQPEVEINFTSKQKPYKCIIWPYDRNGVFKERQEFIL
jgi:Glycosyltransferase (GlcNAc)